MQATNKVLRGQTFVDMVCQQSGSYEDVIETAVMLGKSITDDVEISETVNVKNILAEETARNLSKIRPASNVSDLDYENEESGISIWGINKDFIVNG